MEKHLRKRLAVFLLGVTAFGLFSWISTLSFIRFVETKYGIAISGIPEPAYIPLGHFKIKRLSASWKDYGRISDGEVSVSFNPFLFFLSRGRISISGRSIALELGRQYAQLAPKKKVDIQRIDVILEIYPSGKPTLELVDVDSQEIKFHMQGKAADGRKQ